MRHKVCRVCKAKFQPVKPMQSVCGLECARDYGKKKTVAQVKEKAKQERKQDKERKEKLKRLSDYAKETEKACNAYIRARDTGLPCISCGKQWESTFQAGHYRSVGAAKHLRFTENNIHSQCVRCNMHLSGNLIGYRVGLVKKIGLARVEEIENNNRVVKWTREGLIEMKKYFNEKTKALRHKQNQT